VLFAILTLALMAYIFSLSAESAEVSSQTSAGLIEKVAETFVPSYKTLPETEKKEYISSLQGVVRTLAHFSIFASLGVFSAGFSATFNGKFYIKLILTQIFCSAYALSDEYHQTFSKGRSFQLSDIFMDSLGAFCGIVFVLIIALIFTKRRCKKGEKERTLESN
jgi:VanZ family protein